MNGSFGTGLGVLIPLMIYLTGCGACLLSIFWKPKIGLYVLLLLIPLQTTRDRLAVFPFGAQMIDLLWFSVLIGLLVKDGYSSFPRSPMFKWLALLAGMTYVSLWWGSIYLRSDLPILFSNPRFSDWKNYMVMPMICIVAAGALKSKRDIQKAVLLIMVATAVVDWSFFRSTAGRDFSHFSYGLRDAGVLGYAGENGFAAFVAQIIVFLTALLFFVREKYLKIVLLVLVSFSTYCLLFSFSRGAYFAALAGVSFVAIFRNKKLLIAIFALLLFWQIVLPPAVQERINMTYGSSDGTGTSLEPSAADRVALWEDAMTLFRENPIVGTGYDTYQFMHRIGKYVDTHNYYMKVLVETGLVGLLLLVVILSRMFSLGFQLYRGNQDVFLKYLGLGFAGLVLCTAVANLFGDRWSYLQVDGYLWVLLGCVMRAQTLKAEPELQRSGELELQTGMAPELLVEQ